MEIIEHFKKKIVDDPKTIVFPEGCNVKILHTVKQLKESGLIEPVILGNFPDVQQAADQASINLENIEIIHPELSSRFELFVDAYCQMRDMPSAVGHRIVKHPLNYAAMMVKTGHAHGMVAGIDHPTEEVIMTSELILGLKKKISVVSSFFLMHVPGFAGGENGQFLFADPAVNPDPDPQQLADIALSTAQSAAEMMDWEPRVAMLSFSTHGSAEHPMVEKVIQAVKIVREKAPNLLVDGEIQADAAIMEDVARKKIVEGSPVAGNANVLIFPDLNAANISSKLVQRMANAASYGPVLQGFNHPVSDLSRGATVEDIVGAAILTAARR